MKHFALLLSVAPFALTSTAIQAQATADPNHKHTQKKASDAAIQQNAQEAQSQGPGAPTPVNASATQGAVDDIVVTGLRASLASAQNVKRNSDAILDAVVAQDIGKLPDDTAAESLARIAGVQVNRYNDEVSGVLVRGLPDVATSYNGREIFTAELRRVQLQDFPAQALAGMEIYKSGTADLIEPGLAGLINVRTRRPFDFKGFVVAGGLRGTYNDESKKLDPGGNILVSDRWDTGAGEMGILVNVTYAQSQYHNGVRYNGTYITDVSPGSVVTPASVGHNFRYPYNVGLYNEGGRRFRPSGNVSLQWKPAYNLELYADGIYQGYRGRSVVDNWDDDLRGNDPTLKDVVLVDGTRQVKSLTKIGGVRQQAYRSTGADQTNTYQGAVGGKWTTGRATISTDLAYETSHYSARNWSLDSALTGPQDVTADFLHDAGVAFSLPNFDVSDATKYLWRGYYERRYRSRGAGLQWRTDLVLDTGWDFLHTLQFGWRLTTRNANLDQGSRYAYTESLKVPFASLPIGPLSLTQNPFRGDVQGFTQYLAPARGGIADDHEKLRDLSRQALAQIVAMNPNDQGYKDAAAAFATDDVQLDPSATFHANEKTYTTYMQGKYGFSLGSVDIDGVAGLRLVMTSGTYSGTSQIYRNGVRTETPRSISQDYVDALPNASMRIKFTPKLQLRLGYTFTRTKPDFGVLNPALNITQVVHDPNQPTSPNDPNANIGAYGSGGNPDLKPLTSHNYDASLEYYFSKTGFVSAAVFYRDLFGFINNYTRYVTDPAYGIIQLSHPENAGQGKIKGAEVNFQTFFDFLPGALSGFGVQANVTYLNGKNRMPNFNQATGAFTYGGYVYITGLSKWTYNLSGFYEKNGITTRLSYNRRSDFVRWYGTDIDGHMTKNGTRPISRLDFSFSYDINKKITVSADVNNILAKPYNDYTTDYYGYQYAQDVRDEGRYFGLGVRFRFGE